jgi:ubiquinone/menaquinone biosynthesis C-methylase UbiE
VKIDRELAVYYEERASEYDDFYERNDYNAELQKLRKWVARHTRNRTVLEVAAGTGFWTSTVASSAKSVTAIDCNAEVLTLASHRSMGDHVCLVQADAFALPNFGSKFQVGMAHLWWSHIEKQRRYEFLLHLAERLDPGGTLLMIDQLYTPHCPKRSRTHCGNRFELRLANGFLFEIVKNYVQPATLRSDLAPFSQKIWLTKTKHFWAARAILR